MTSVKHLPWATHGTYGPEARAKAAVARDLGPAHASNKHHIYICIYIHTYKYAYTMFWIMCGIYESRTCYWCTIEIHTYMFCICYTHTYKHTNIHTYIHTYILHTFDDTRLMAPPPSEWPSAALRRAWREMSTSLRRWAVCNRSPRLLLTGWGCLLS